MIAGIGIDIISVERIEKGFEKFGIKFLEKIFTKAEIEYCGRHASVFEHYAGKFSVKEAFMKSIGAGIRQGVWFKDIEVLNRETQQPYVQVYNKAAAYLSALGNPNIHISITHTNDNAAAVVILEK